MNGRKPGVFWALASAVVLVLVSAGAAEAHRGREMGGSSQPDEEGGDLYGVGVIASDDAWTAGCCGTHVLQHWDGTGWQQVQAPGGAKWLYDVDGASSDDVWAVGDDSLVHWDGHQWTLTQVDEDLRSVSAVSADDVWATGSDGYPAFNGVILRWNGVNWREVGQKHPNSSYRVDADASNDVWVAGVQGKTGVIKHWDGSRWTRLSSPVQGFYPDTVTVLSPDDVWIGGNGSTGFLHWNGTELTAVRSPWPGTFPEVNGIDGASSTDVWAVGDFWNGHSQQRGLLLHWDGVAWKRFAVPGIGHHWTWLHSVSVISADDAWLVGSHLLHNRASFQIIEHWDGTAWTRIS